jgi:uncharacterized membrane protein
MIMLLGLVFMLGLAEVGYLYWTKRSMQKVVDLAALAGAQRLADCSADGSDNAAARGSATGDNGFGGTLAIACGQWDPQIPGDQHFETGGDEAPNAVSVVATARPAAILGLAGAMPTLQASAIATGKDPWAAFSVGSRLAGVSADSPLGMLLDSTLGTSLGLKLVSYEGVANAQVSLLGLKNLLHLDAGTVDGVLDAPVTVSDLLDATVQLLAASPDSVDVDVAFVQQQAAAIEAQVGDLTLTLGDFLNVQAVTSDPASALDTDLAAGDLIAAALQAANARHAAELDAGTIDLLGMAQADVALTIVEPPKIGIGGPGTTAHTAQVRVRLNLRVAGLPGGQLLYLPAVVRVSMPAGQALSLPLNLELAPATATLDDIRCHVPSPLAPGYREEVTLHEQTGIVNAFVGNLPGALADDDRSWQEVVQDAVADGSAFANLASLRVSALLTLVQADLALRAYVDVPLSTGGTSARDHVFSVDPSVPLASQDLVDTVDTGQDVLAAVDAAILDPTQWSVDRNAIHDLSLLGVSLAGVVNPIRNNLTSLLQSFASLIGPALQPALLALEENLTAPLLKTLGVEVGAVDVRLLSVHCDGGPTLVY